MPNFRKEVKRNERNPQKKVSDCLRDGGREKVESFTE
jgi:hypothetical protein